MTEQVQPQSGQPKYLIKNLLTAIIANATSHFAVENAKWRLVSNKNLGIKRNWFLIMQITGTVELHTIDGYTAVLQKVNVGGQILDAVSLVETKIVIAAYENLVLVRQPDKPIEKIETLILRSAMADVATMHNHIGLGQMANLTVKTVSIGKM